MRGRSEVAMLLFLASESVFFVMLILAYVYFRHSPANPAGAGPGVLDVPHTAAFTACLLASSLTVWLAGRSLKRDRQWATQLWLAATVVLGAIFLVGQGTEYLGLIDKHVTIDRDVFGTAFFTLTGFHSFHVFAGLVALVVVLGLAIAGDFSPDRRSAVSAVSLYWHFVDAVWVVIFSVVYLWSLAG